MVLVASKRRAPPALPGALEVWRSLAHPSICALRDVFADARGVYLVLEPATGGDLLGRVAEAGAGFSHHLARRLGKQVLEAVQHLQEKQVAHRGLVPAALHFRKPGPMDEQPLVLVDLSKCCRCSGPLSDTPGGPLAFHAPEVLDLAYGLEADTWSCGCLLYLLLCGGPPFEGTDLEVQAGIRAQQTNGGADAFAALPRDAQDLLRQLLSAKKTRPTAQQALAHEFFSPRSQLARQPTVPEDFLPQEAVLNLSAFQSQNTLQKNVMRFFAQDLEASDASLRALKETLLKCDKDGDGKITFTELQSTLGKVGFAGQEDLLRQMKEADKDGTGLDIREFMASAISEREAFNEEVCWEAFRTFDLDGSGSISKDELAQLLGADAVKKVVTKGMGVKTSEIDRIIADADKDGDGQIDFEEFMIMMGGAASVDMGAAFDLA